MSKESKGVFVQLPQPVMTLETHILIEMAKALVSSSDMVTVNYTKDSNIPRWIAYTAERIKDELLIKINKK